MSLPIFTLISIIRSPSKPFLYDIDHQDGALLSVITGNQVSILVIVDTQLRYVIHIAPLAAHPSSSQGAHSAKSTIQSSFTSPSKAKEDQKKSLVSKTQLKFHFMSLILLYEETDQLVLRSSIHMAPLSLHQSSSWFAQTARSIILSLLISQREVIEKPKLSLSSNIQSKLPSVSLIFWDDFTVPSESKNRIHTAPLSVHQSSLK